MKKILISIAMIMMFTLISCNLLQALGSVPPETPDPTPTNTEPSPTTPTPTEEPPQPSSTPTEESPQPLTLEETADQVVNALADMDMEIIADFVHPEMGLRFSPYTYVTEEDLVFWPGELTALFESDEIYTWGSYDGTGFPIELTFTEYFDDFVYSADFANPEEMAINEELGWSSMINNIEEFYPGSSFVEYYFSGFDEQYGGLDWRSLRLVFIEEGGTWYLVGIVNDQWTT